MMEYLGCAVRSIWGKSKRDTPFGRLANIDVSVVDMVHLSPEATEVALAVAKISELGVRREVTDAILNLMKKYFSE